MRLEKIRIGLDRLNVMLGGLIGPAQRVKRCRQVIVSLGIQRINIQCLPIVIDRLIEFALPLKR